ncbi:MAG: hypothetical protein M3466_15885, partial [Gemmatimonadota bacterium]|nr:hypothetical protein [Gemmatimonadota bacterium]
VFALMTPRRKRTIAGSPAVKQSRRAPNAGDTALYKRRVAEGLGGLVSYGASAGVFAPTGRHDDWTRKNMDMDQNKLDAAKKILGVRTETDAVDAALDLVLFHSEVRAGIDRMVAAGGIGDVYERG